MKIGMIVHDPPYQGGLVQYCILLVNKLLKQNVNLKLVGFKNIYPSFIYPGVLPKKNKVGIEFNITCKKIIKWYNPLTWIKAYNSIKECDILHLHWISPILSHVYWSILKLNKMFSKKRVILTCHNIEQHESTPIDKMLINMVFSKVDHFIVHAEQNKERLIKNYGINEDKISVIAHGNFEFFTNWKSKNNLKKKFNLENKKILLFFGYIREYKGLRYLLYALPNIIKKEPNIKLIIAGELWGKWDKYQKIINKYHLHKYVQLVPHYILDKEVHKYFNIADIVVLPYDNPEQTISGPLLVSLAFGKPTVVCKVGGVKEIIKNNYNGLLVNRRNVVGIADSIINLLKNKSLRNKLRKNALKTNKKYRWSNVATEYKKVYEKLSKGL